MHPVLLTIGPFSIQTFWAINAIGLIIAGYITMIAIRKFKMPISFILDHSLPLTVGTIIGARIFYVIINHFQYISFYEFHPASLLRIFFIWDRGLYIDGGIIGFSLVLYFLCRKYHESILKWLDTLSIPFFFMMIFNKLGAFFAGFDYGNETNLPIGVLFESPDIRYTVPIHPTQIYAVIYLILIIVFLRYLINHYKLYLRNGFILGYSIILYSFFRFLEELVRGDYTTLIGDIRINSITSLIGIVFGGYFLYHRYNNFLQNK